MSKEQRTKKFVSFGNVKVSVIKGDITEQQVNVIVNSTNRGLNLNEGRASKALLSAAGDEIQNECEQNYPYGIQDGEIAITSGGNMSCKNIYHGALSKYSTPGDEQTISDLVSNCLAQANQHQHHSVALQAFGTGFLSYPLQRVAEITFSCIQTFASQTPSSSVSDIHIVIFPTATDCYQAFVAEARKHSVGTQAATFSTPDSGITRKTSHQQLGKLKIKVLVGALHDTQADVLVCSGPKDLQLSNGGLSEALLKVAGSEMQDELNEKYENGIEYGEIAVSRGHRLKCKFVYHGALPKWGTHPPDPLQTMDAFMNNCLETANSHSSKRIAFPTLGLGSLEFPWQKTIKKMVEIIRKFSQKQHRIRLEKVIIVIFKGNQNSTQIESELLKEIGGKPAASAPSSTFYGHVGKIHVNLHVGNLAEQVVDVIVNSTSPELGLSAGISAAIADGAGDELANEISTKYPNGIQQGEIAETKGHDLKCKAIFHGTIPSWYSKHSGAKLPDEVLEEFMYDCLKKADGQKFKSIAFPAVGTGFQKFPADVSAASIISSIDKFDHHETHKSITEIRIVLYSESSDLSSLEKAFKDELTHVKSAANNASGPARPVPLRKRQFRTEPKRGTKAYLEWKYREELRTPPYWTKFTRNKKLKDWNLAIKPGSSSLQDIDQNTFSAIETALTSTLGTIRVVTIQRLENTDLFLKYGEECQRLFRKASVEGGITALDQVQGSSGLVKAMKHLTPDMIKHTNPEINEYYFFHATKYNYVDVILGQGLDNRLASNGRLGSGVYGAEVASKSHQYAGCNSKGEYPIFLMRMCLGDIFITRSSGNYKRPPCKKCGNPICTTHQELYDSIVADGGAFFDREFVVYDNQSYPEYLVWYTCG